MTTYTDDGKRFYAVRDSDECNQSVILADTFTGFEIHMSRARFERDFREEQEPVAA